MLFVFFPKKTDSMLPLWVATQRQGSLYDTNKRGNPSKLPYICIKFDPPSPKKRSPIYLEDHPRNTKWPKTHNPMVGSFPSKPPMGFFGWKTIQPTAYVADVFVLGPSGIFLPHGPVDPSPGFRLISWFGESGGDPRRSREPHHAIPKCRG